MTTTTYDHDGLLLNVTVDRDEDGCEVVSVTTSGDISHLFNRAALASIAECVDAQLSREARQQNALARAERHHERVMNDPVRYWLTH